jgi:hypothetical protein
MSGINPKIVWQGQGHHQRWWYSWDGILGNNESEGERSEGPDPLGSSLLNLYDI